MGGLSPQHWLVVIIAGLALLLIFNGSRKIPELARGLGRGVRIFKSEINELKKDDQNRETKESSEPAAAAQLPTAAKKDDEEISHDISSQSA